MLVVNDCVPTDECGSVYRPWCTVTGGVEAAQSESLPAVYVKQGIYVQDAPGAVPDSMRFVHHLDGDPEILGGFIDLFTLTRAPEPSCDATTVGTGGTLLLTKQPTGVFFDTGSTHVIERFCVRSGGVAPQELGLVMRISVNDAGITIRDNIIDGVEPGGGTTRGQRCRRRRGSGWIDGGGRACRRYGVYEVGTNPGDHFDLAVFTHNAWVQLLVGRDTTAAGAGAWAYREVDGTLWCVAGVDVVATGQCLDGAQAPGAAAGFTGNREGDPVFAGADTDISERPGALGLADLHATGAVLQSNGTQSLPQPVASDFEGDPRDTAAPTCDIGHDETP